MSTFTIEGGKRERIKKEKTVECVWVGVKEPNPPAEEAESCKSHPDS